MNATIKLFFLITFTLCFMQTFGQSSVTKKDLCGQWDFDSFADSMKVGDILLFKSDKKGNDTFLKRNGTLQKHTFYAHCGNKTFSDYFSRKPPKWETIGKWQLTTADHKTILTMTTGDKTLSFLLLSQDKKPIKFILQKN